MYNANCLCHKFRFGFCFLCCYKLVLYCVEATIFIVHITNEWGSFDLVVNLSGVALLNRLFEIYADTISWRFRGIKKLQTNLTLSQLTESTTLHISLSGGGSCFSLESWCMVR